MICVWQTRRKRLRLRAAPEVQTDLFLPARLVFRVSVYLDNVCGETTSVS